MESYSVVEFWPLHESCYVSLEKKRKSYLMSSIRDSSENNLSYHAAKIHPIKGINTGERQGSRVRERRTMWILGVKTKGEATNDPRSPFFLRDAMLFDQNLEHVQV